MAKKKKKSTSNAEIERKRKELSTINGRIREEVAKNRIAKQSAALDRKIAAAKAKLERLINSKKK